MCLFEKSVVITECVCVRVSLCVSVFNCVWLGNTYLQLTVQMSHTG